MKEKRSKIRFGRMSHSVRIEDILRVKAKVDAMSEEQMNAFWFIAHDPSKAFGKSLFPREQGGYLRVTQAFANYASNLAASKLSRRLMNDHLSEKMYQDIANAILDTMTGGGWTEDDF